MWPILLDMTKEESMQHLRCLEIDAYSGLVSAFRAQGVLDAEKLKLLRETGNLLHITQERHKAEIRRVVNDEKLCTIAYHVNGEVHSADEWIEEGQRLIPLIPRQVPQTAYSAIADEVADTANKINKQLPSPSCTERKRPVPVSPTHSIPPQTEMCNKTTPFRVVDSEVKKRKLSLSLETSPLAQHLMGPPKISKIQQIYRQKSKARQKELIKVKHDGGEKTDYIHVQPMSVSKPQQVMVHSPKIAQQSQAKITVSQFSPSTTTLTQGNSKINILQNISIQSPLPTAPEEPKSDLTMNSTNSGGNEKEVELQPGCSADNGQSKLIRLSDNKTIKVCTARKTLTPKTVTTSSGQKLIVVSNPQSLTTSSILQRTLTTIPIKNISLKSFDKFKIVTSTSSSSTQPTQIQLPNSKKLVTMKAGTPVNKKMVPLSQVQVLNTKTGIKVLPFGSKLIPKTIVNSNLMYAITNTQSETADTKSTTSTPTVMSSKLQDVAVTVPPVDQPVADATGDVSLSDTNSDKTEASVCSADLTGSENNVVETKNQDNKEVEEAPIENMDVTLTTCVEEEVVTTALPLDDIKDPITCDDEQTCVIVDGVLKNNDIITSDSINLFNSVPGVTDKGDEKNIQNENEEENIIPDESLSTNIETLEFQSKDLGNS